MSEYVKFTPNGLFLFKWNGKKREYVEKTLKNKSIIIYLRSSCEIEEGTTLQNIFDAVDQYPALKSFIAKYSWCRDIEAFHEQAKEYFNPEDQELNYLELVHTPSLHNYEGVRYGTYVSFYGMGPIEEELKSLYPNSDPNELISYSISYTPMYKLADLPVRLNKEFKVIEPLDRKKIRKEGYKPETIIDAECEFTLLEVLDGIYWDISFMGGPEDNKDFLNSMNDKKLKKNSKKILKNLKKTRKIHE